MEEIVINLSELTWGELEEVEKHAGAEATADLINGKVRPSATVVLLWIAKRRTEPSFTLEEARKLPINTPLSVEGGGNPTANGDASAGSSFPKSATSTASAPSTSPS